jgi:hypothetical protein
VNSETGSVAASSSGAPFDVKRVMAALPVSEFTGRQAAAVAAAAE